MKIKITDLKIDKTKERGQIPQIDHDDVAKKVAGYQALPPPGPLRVTAWEDSGMARFAFLHKIEAGSDPRGHLEVTWGVYLCAGKPPLADIILSHPPELTRCDTVIGLAIPAMSGHIQYRGAASGDLYIRISGIKRVFLS